MSITPFEKDMNIISALDDEPNDVGGLTAAELKAKFDEGGVALKAYINDTLAPALDGSFATKEELQGVVLGQIPDGTITEAKLAPEVTRRFDEAGEQTEEVRAEADAIRQDIDGYNLPISPATAAALNAETVDAALLAIPAMMRFINVTVVNDLGNPIPNVPLTGLFSPRGAALSTNALGKASGFLADNNIISLSGYADRIDESFNIATLFPDFQNIVLVYRLKELLTITSSTTLKFASVELDACLIGGGGAGAGTYIGAGGGAGSMVNVLNLKPVPGQSYSAVVAAGGNGISNAAGQTGGTSTFMGNSAPGGSGGTASSGGIAGSLGMGNGGNCPPAGSNGNPGGSSTVYPFNDPAMPWYGGGGGSGAYSSSYTPGYGGAPNGGRGFGSTGAPTAGGIGGGGGGGASSQGYSTGGNGGPGAILLRMRNL